MTDWVKCTSMDGKPFYINMAAVMSAFWNDHERCCILSYGDDPDETLSVRERPEAILTVREPDA